MTMRREAGAEIPTLNLPGLIGEIKSLTTAAGGNSVDTTATRILLGLTVEQVYICAHTFSTAVVAKFAFLPYLSVFKTIDAGATWTDYSSASQDNSASTDVVLSSLSTAANGDYLYVGAHRKFGGITVDVDAANGNTSVLTAEVWTGREWSAQTISDGSASGGATMAVDGDITWTALTGWARSQVNGLNLYWIRFKVSAALDSSCTLNSIWPVPAARAELNTVMPTFSASVHTGPYGVSAVELIADAGTVKVIVNVATSPGESF